MVDQELGTSRGAAFGDLDNDGDVDVVYSDLDARVKLLRNEASGAWIGFTLHDKRGKEIPGAMVGVQQGETVRWRLAEPAYSYLASNDPRAQFGLGDAGPVTGVTVRWPNGDLEEFGPMEAGSYHLLRQGKGLEPAADEGR